MFNFKSVVRFYGLVFLLFSALTVFPTLIDYHNADDIWARTAIIGGLYLFIGGTLFVAMPSEDSGFLRRNFWLIILSFWVLSSVVGSLPFFVANVFQNYVDCLIESTAAICTTGIKIGNENINLSDGLLFFRGELQLVGAMAFIIFTLNFMREFYDDEFKKTIAVITNVTKSTAILYHAKYLGLFYGILITFGVLIFSALFDLEIKKSFPYIVNIITAGGMLTEEVLCFSEKNYLFSSIVIFYMFLSGLSLITIIPLMKGKWNAILQDAQLKIYSQIIFVASFFCLLSDYFQNHLNHEGINRTLFSIVAAASGNWINSENSFLLGVAVLLGLIGGCSGSASSGIKISRAKEILMTFKNGYFIVFFIVFQFSVLVFLFCGISFANATEIAVKSLLNMGTIDLTTLTETQFQKLGALLSKLVISICMIASRMEFIFIFLVYKNFFHKRSLKK